MTKRKNTKQTIKRCQKLQKYIEKLDKDEIKLENEVHSDYAHFFTHNDALGRKYQMYKVEEGEDEV
jgi:hypothetical protein